MNYKRIYNELVERRKTSPYNGYTENHHIIPRCMGGTDTEENIVALSAREHFIAHQLLYKIYKTYKLLCAITLMCTDRNGNRLNNRLYSWHRERFAKETSKYMKTYWENNPHPRGMLGKKHSIESLQKIVLPLRKRAKEVSIEINKFSLNGDFIERFDSLAEASRSVNGSRSNIKYCAEGKFQYAYGFRWSYLRNPNFSIIKPRNYKGARGKISINDGNTNKLINNYEPIPSGWVRGRIKVGQ